jgi:hypothetical protein
LGQVIQTPLEKLLVGHDADGGRAVGGIRHGQVQWVKVGAQHAFAGRRAFHLADEGHARPIAQRGHEVTRRGSNGGLPLELVQWQVVHPARKFFGSFVIYDLVKYSSHRRPVSNRSSVVGCLLSAGRRLLLAELDETI